MITRSLVMTVALSFAVICTAFSASSASKQPPEPLNKFNELKNMKYVGDSVVIVKKDIYGGDMKTSAILKGKIRNITTKAIQNIYVVWAIYDSDKNLYTINKYNTPMPSLFMDKIEYLDGKAEADFSIPLDFYAGMGIPDAQDIRRSIVKDLYATGAFIKK